LSGPWRLVCAALAVAAAVIAIRGLTEGDDYLGDGRWGYGAFFFAPLVVVVCGYIAAGAPLPPPRALWVVVAAAYVAFGLAVAL
jgi:hypothetical protein